MGTMKHMRDTGYTGILKHIKAFRNQEVKEIWRDSKKGEAMGFMVKERQEEEDGERCQGKKHRG